MKLLYLFICLLFWSCFNTEPIKTEIAELPDSLFPFKDIKNSLIVNNLWYNTSTYELFADSAKQTHFIRLDSIQRLKIMLPVMIKEIDADTSYILQYMPAVFVSKQKKVGEYTPIIVLITGDDYDGLFYILLDKQLNYVSHLLLHGGIDGGPNYLPDSVMEMPPTIHSFLNGREIYSHYLTEYFRPADTVKHFSIFDSINYKSVILPSGQIQTTMVDSVRFKRMSKW
jgi:hypothetical protein